ncbi:MAG: nitroreductase family protein [Candidatus Nanoarchaeia archaeon]
MELLTCIKSRRSVRAFKPTKIPEEILHAILDAANFAPCAGGIQNWRFLVVEDESKKKIVAKAALEQEWIAQAPVIVIICSDPELLEKEYDKRGVELYDYQNAALAAENLMLAAWNFGIGSTFVGSFTEFRLRKEFRIPDSIRIHAIIPLGLPAEVPKPIQRIGIEDIVFFEEWGKVVSKEREFAAGLIFPETSSSPQLRIGELAEKALKGAVKGLKRRIKGDQSEVRGIEGKKSK